MTFSLGQSVTNGCITGRVIARVKASGVPCIWVRTDAGGVLLAEAVCREVAERRLRLVWSEGREV